MCEQRLEAGKGTAMRMSGEIVFTVKRTQSAKYWSRRARTGCVWKINSGVYHGARLYSQGLVNHWKSFGIKLNDRLYYPAWAVITKCHRLGGLNTESYSSLLWRLKSPTSRYQLTQILVRDLFLVDSVLLAVSLPGREIGKWEDREDTCLFLFYDKAPALWIRAPSLWPHLILLPTKGPVSTHSHGGSWAPMCEFWGFSPQKTRRHLSRAVTCSHLMTTLLTMACGIKGGIRETV